MSNKNHHEWREIPAENVPILKGRAPEKFLLQDTGIARSKIQDEVARKGRVTKVTVSARHQMKNISRSRADGRVVNIVARSLRRESWPLSTGGSSSHWVRILYGVSWRYPTEYFSQISVLRWKVRLQVSRRENKKWDIDLPWQNAITNTLGVEEDSMVHYADGQERQLDRRLKTEEILDETLSPRNAAQHENYSSTTDPYQASKADSIISHETCQQQLSSCKRSKRKLHQHGWSTLPAFCRKSCRIFIRRWSIHAWLQQLGNSRHIVVQWFSGDGNTIRPKQQVQ